MHDCQQLKDYGFNGSGIFHVVPVGSCKGFIVICQLTTVVGWLAYFGRQRSHRNRRPNIEPVIIYVCVLLKSK